MPLLTLPALFGVAIGFVVVFGLVILGIVGLYMSNQIAGPLYRTKLCMDRVGKGDWGFNLQFRHGDFLRDLPGVFNQMAGKPPGDDQSRAGGAARASGDRTGR